MRIERQGMNHFSQVVKMVHTNSDHFEDDLHMVKGL
jgi:hypothetical protein